MLLTVVSHRFRRTTIGLVLCLAFLVSVALAHAGRLIDSSWWWLVLAPLAMLLSMIAGLAGMLVPAISGWFAWPAQILLTYMLDMTHLLSRIPHVFAQNLSFSWPEMVAWYVLIAGFTTALWFKRKSKTAIITDERISDGLSQDGAVWDEDGAPKRSALYGA